MLHVILLPRLRFLNQCLSSAVLLFCNDFLTSRSTPPLLLRWFYFLPAEKEQEEKEANRNAMLFSPSSFPVDPISDPKILHLSQSPFRHRFPCMPVSFGWTLGREVAMVGVEVVYSAIVLFLQPGENTSAARCT